VKSFYLKSDMTVVTAKTETRVCNSLTFLYNQKYLRRNEHVNYITHLESIGTNAGTQSSPIFGFIQIPLLKLHLFIELTLLFISFEQVTFVLQ